VLRLQPRFDNSVEAVSPPCQRTFGIVARAPCAGKRSADKLIQDRMRYALVCASMSFILGLGLGLGAGKAIPVFVPLSIAGAAAGLALLGGRVRWTRWLLFAAICMLGVVRSASIDPFPSWLSLRAQGLREVTGTVVSYPSLGEDHVAFTLRADQLPGALRVTWFPSQRTTSRVYYGDRLALVGSVRLPEVFSGFDYPAYLANQGIFATMFVDGDASVSYAGAAGNLMLRLGDRVRQSLLRRLEDSLGPREVGLAQGLLLGDRAALSDDVEDAFRRTGLMHVLAVSGLHLGIVLAGAWFALRRAGVRSAVAYPVVGLLVLLVLWIVGPRVSLVRASLLFAFLGMGSVLADLGLILRRTVNPLNGLAAAAVVILAMRPTELFEAGFQLSFAATAGILIVVSSGFRGRWQQWIHCVSDRTGRLAPLVRYALTLIAISAAAQASVAPVVAWHFGTFHPLQLGLNLVVVPTVTLALWVGLPGILLLASTGAASCVAPFGWLLRALSWTVETSARIPVVEYSVSQWFGLWLAALVVFLLLALRYSSDESS